MRDRKMTPKFLRNPQQRSISALFRYMPLVGPSPIALLAEKFLTHSVFLVLAYIFGLAAGSLGGLTPRRQGAKAISLCAFAPWREISLVS